MSAQSSARDSLLGLFQRLFLHAESGRLGLTGLIGAGALMQATAIFCLTHGAAALVAGEKNPGLLYGPLWIDFLLATTLFVSAKFLALQRGTQMAEAFAAQSAEQLVTDIRVSELHHIERLGRERLRSALSVDLPLIEQHSLLAVHSLQAAALIISCLFLLLFIAPAALAMMAVGAYIGTQLLRRETRQLALAGAGAEQRERHFDTLLGHLLYGFRELKCDPPKAQGLLDGHLLPASEAARDARVAAGRVYVRKLTLFNWIFLPTLSAIAFILPLYGVHDGVSGAIVLALLWTPFVDLLTGVPNLISAGDALQRLERLRVELESEVRASSSGSPAPHHFEQLTLHGIRFRHGEGDSEHGFEVGPLDLTLNAGEVLFITGGNGSGKSTLMRLLCGLYTPQHGNRRVNGRTLGADDYRALFTTVLSDYHLFEQLYRETPADPARVAALLGRLGLAEKTRFDGDAFEHRDLSSGQRRRLALLVALLDERPIYLFDEWTADQDPGFRRDFYDQLLPELRAQGRCVVCVTHDDRYFDRADRIVHLVDGRIVAEEAP